MVAMEFPLAALRLQWISFEGSDVEQDQKRARRVLRWRNASRHKGG
jgi:hypothetical protein